LAERVDAVLDGQGTGQAFPVLPAKTVQHEAGAQTDPNGHPVFENSSHSVQVEI
jgi:hypothetical protein